MDSDDDFGCLGIPSPLEMWKQQSVLLATEIEEYQRDLRKARVNVAKLVLMNDSLTVERDRLQVELRTASHELSEAYRELSMTKNTLASCKLAESRRMQGEYPPRESLPLPAGAEIPSVTAAKSHSR